MCIRISGNNFITYMRKKTNLVIFTAGKISDRKYVDAIKQFVPMGCLLACFQWLSWKYRLNLLRHVVFIKKKSIPDTQIIYSTSFRYIRFANNFFPQLLQKLTSISMLQHPGYWHKKQISKQSWPRPGQCIINQLPVTMVSFFSRNKQRFDAYSSIIRCLIFIL